VTPEFIIFITSFFVLMAIGVPIAFCMGVSSLIYLTQADIANVSVIFGRMAATLDNYLYTAVAFFILASTLMNTAGITQRIFDFADAMVGHLRGGLAQVNVFASVIFSGMTGTALGDAAGLGRIEIHAMRQAGYKPEFAGAVTIASAVIGPIIPPSMTMIIYAEMAEVSIADLFLGGVFPGLIIGACLMGYIYFGAYKGGPPPLPARSWRGRALAFRKAFLPMLSPLIVVGGIVTGAITPTEAAVVAVLYAVLLSILYRSADLREVADAVRIAALGTATPLFIVTTAMIFSWIVTIEQVPYLLVDVLGGVVENWILTVLLLNLVMLIMGMFLEGIGVLILLVPIFKPIALAAGIDLVHLGVFMTLNVMVGLITPPIGLSLFVAADITGCSLPQIARAVAPFLIPIIGSLLVISLVPETVTWLPNVLLH
jgi:tripartite ATP-independent transporter DctM subunit